MGKKVVVISTDHHSNDSRVFYKCVLPLSERYEIAYAWDARFDDGENAKIIASQKKEHFRIGFYPIYRSAPGFRGRLEMLQNALSLLKKERPDACHLHCGPLSFYLAKKIKKISPNCKVVYDAHEWDPESYTRMPFLNKMAPLVRWGTCLFEKKHMKYIDLVISVSWHIHSFYQELSNGNVPGIVLLNLLPGDDMEEIWDSRYRDNDTGRSERKVSFVFSGIFFPDRKLELCAELVGIIRKKGWDSELLLFGKFGNSQYEERFLDFLRDKGYFSFVRFMGFIPLEDMCFQIRNMSWAFNIMADRPENNCGLPNKLFHYLQSAVPVIIGAHQKEAKKLLQNNSAGIAIDIANLDKAAEEILHVFKDEKKYAQLKNGARRFAQQYTMVRLKKILLSSYAHLLKEKADS